MSVRMSKMPSGVKSSNSCPDTSCGMGTSSDTRKGSRRQQNSKLVKETVFPFQSNWSLKHLDNLKAKSCGSKSCGNLPRETPGNCQQLSTKIKASKDDELVKYMSNLPGYLQRVERGENIQDKALNVGVLDWTRLEKWKWGEKDNPTGHGSYPSLAGSNSSTKMTTRSAAIAAAVHKEPLIHQSKCKPSLFSSPASFHNDGSSQGTKPSIQNVIGSQDFHTASKNSLDGHKRRPWARYSSGGSNSDVVPEMRQDQKIISKMRNWSSATSSSGSPITPRENVRLLDNEANKGVGEMQVAYVKKKASDQKIHSNMGTSSSKPTNYDVPLCSKEKKVGNGETRERIQKQESASDLCPRHLPSEYENIVLLLPRKFSENGFSRESKLIVDANLTEEDWSSLSDSFSNDEVLPSPSELHSEVPHSCPLPSTADTNTKFCKTHATINSQNADLSFDSSHRSALSHIRLSTSGCEERISITSPNRNVIGTSNVLDEESAEVNARKGRHPSPNRRFSFSLGRMTKSFSFKESSSAPSLGSKYDSVKFGPVSSKASLGLDNFNREKGSGHSRARSSPLRRILDPLLKSKSVNPVHPTETDQLLKGSLNSFSFKPITAIEVLQNEKHKETSTIRALLHLAIRNGRPLFRFVVNSHGSILAATMNNLPSMNDMSCNCTFYSIDEIKKKSSSWKNHSKEKGHGYFSNVVGQMKCSTSSSVDLTTDNSTGHSMVARSVLYDVELRQADKASPKFTASRELAAVVVNLSCKSMSLHKQQSVKAEDLKEKAFSWCLSEDSLVENGQHESTIVILPDGIHGLPNKGVPTSLIHRWRFGGSCDCGGWDVGCKLCILSNENKHNKIPGTSKACPPSDCFELFTQGGPQQDKPIFSLAPIKKEMYSVEFSPSISLLQAFFISVTVLSCQKLPDLAEVANPSGERAFLEPRVDNDRTKKINMVVLGELPVKYTPNPPLSPIGRV